MKILCKTVFWMILCIFSKNEFMEKSGQNSIMNSVEKHITNWVYLQAHTVRLMILLFLAAHWTNSLSHEELSFQKNQWAAAKNDNQTSPIIYIWTQAAHCSLRFFFLGKTGTKKQNCSMKRYLQNVQVLVLWN